MFFIYSSILLAVLVPFTLMLIIITVIALEFTNEQRPFMIGTGYICETSFQRDVMKYNILLKTK